MKPAPMKRFSPALLLLLNGCFSCGTVSHVQPVEENLKVYRPAVPPLSDRHGSASLNEANRWLKDQRELFAGLEGLTDEPPPADLLRAKSPPARRHRISE